MTKDTGGPAFPTPSKLGVNDTSTWIAEIPSQPGMTLRDYFAAKAMQALIIANGPAPTGGWAAYAERTAYTVADAMLKERDGNS